VLKRLLAFALVLGLLLVGAYVAGGWLLAAATRRMLPAAAEEVGRTGLRISRLAFGSAQVWPIAHCSWRDWRVEVIPAATRRRPQPDPLRIRAAEIEAEVTQWSPLTVRLSARGLVLDSALDPEAPEDAPFAAAEFSVPVEKIDEGRLEIAGLAATGGPVAAVRALATDFAAFARQGKAKQDFQFGARLHFHLRGESFVAHVETERVGGYTVLRLNRADIDEFARHYRRPLTDGEKAILHEYPLRAPLLVRIMEYAERTAGRLAKLDRALPEKPTRHVLWSYWLTRTFDAEFAERVTNAHEAGGEIESEAVHQQDFANNATGRSYATARKSEHQVLQLIKTDPAIVRLAR
jgi:hypothetical protein